MRAKEGGGDDDDRQPNEAGGRTENPVFVSSHLGSVPLKR